MNKYTQQSAINTGAQRAADDVRAFAVSVSNSLKKDIDKMSESHYVALAAAIFHGEWNRKQVTQSLITCGAELVFEQIQTDFICWHILARENDSYVLSYALRASLDTHMDTIIAQAAPAMVPFSEDISPWIYPYHELGLPLVANVPEHVLKQLTAERMPYVYSAVNRLQSVSYEVSEPLLQHLSKVFAKPNLHKSTVQQLSIQTTMLREMAQLESFRFLVTMDFRGRMYYRGGLITPQGADFQKAAIQFHEALPLGEHGMDALGMHFANAYGKDKLSIKERLEWANTEGAGIAAQMARGQFFPEADSPFQAYTAGVEWARVRRLVREGIPAQEITSKLICHQDGTCNGLQHGAALTGCRSTAVAVNCTASTESDCPNDIYQVAADHMLSYIKASLSSCEALLNELSTNGRKYMKLPVMVTGYGAGTATAVRDFIRVLAEENVVAAQQAHSNEAVITNAMADVLADVAGGMVSLNGALQSLVKPIADQPLRWKTRDGFWAYQASRFKFTEHSSTDERQFIARGTEFETRVDGISKSAQVTGISANFVHSIDADHLRGVIRSCDHPLATVHDSIGSHAGTFHETAAIIREQFVSTHAYHWIDSICHYNKQPAIKVRSGDYSAIEALQSKYIFS